MRLRTILQSKLILAGSGILLLFISVHTWKIFYKNLDANRDIDRLKKEVSVLEQHQKKLQELHTFLSSDFFAEKEARLKLGMQKEGERAIVVRGGEDSFQQEEKPNKQITMSASFDGKAIIMSSKKKGNPESWWDYFFGK